MNCLFCNRDIIQTSFNNYCDLTCFNIDTMLDTNSIIVIDNKINESKTDLNNKLKYKPEPPKNTSIKGYIRRIKHKKMTI